jgi:hypothetical protein
MSTETTKTDLQKIKAYLLAMMEDYKADGNRACKDTANLILIDCVIPLMEVRQAEQEVRQSDIQKTFASVFPTDKQREVTALLNQNASELRTDVGKWTDLTEFQQFLFLLMHPPVPLELNWYSALHNHVFSHGGVLRSFSCVLISASSDAKLKQMVICQEEKTKLIDSIFHKQEQRLETDPDLPF